MNNFQFRTLALGGVFKSAALVYELSNRGTLDETMFTDCVKSIFCTSPDSPMDVIGSVEKMTDGLNELISQFSNDADKRNMDIARYVVSMLFLERRLAKNATILSTLSSGIEMASRQSEHFSLTHENVIASLADLYSRTISELGPRIMVSGDQDYLSNPKTANQVRTILLAGIRCAVLWQQLGARRWHILFNRRRYVNEAKALLSGIEKE